MKTWKLLDQEQDWQKISLFFKSHICNTNEFIIEVGGKQK